MCENLGSLPNGCHLFRKKNEAGGYIYYSDEIGGNVIVWDTCLVHQSTLLAAMACEHYRIYAESMRNQGHEISKEMEMEDAAATGGSFLGSIKNEEMDINDKICGSLKTLLSPDMSVRVLVRAVNHFVFGQLCNNAIPKLKVVEKIGYINLVVAEILLQDIIEVSKSPLVLSIELEEEIELL